MIAPLLGCGDQSPSAGQVGLSSSAPQSDELPVEHLFLSEDAPVDAAEAFELSDIVVVGTVNGLVGQRRLYGVDPEDPQRVGTEDVTVSLTVTQVLKGQVGSSVEFGFPAFSTKSGQRRAQLDVAGVNISLIRGRAVWFLKDYGDPYGLVPVALTSAMMVLDSNDIVRGPQSEVFDRYIGRSLHEVLEQSNG